jgi:SAM-dependent methyltransferase
MDDEVEALLAEQFAYYRAHASDYDDAYLGQPWDRCIDELPITGDVLELACGTGHWTPLLARRARSVTPSTPPRSCSPWHGKKSGACRWSSSRPTCSAGSRRAATTRCSLGSG